MTAKEIAKDAISKMNKKITNEIFLIIQNDRKLMQEYLREIEAKGLDSVNTQIGKEIKRVYNLDDGNREDKPTCTLIQSHQKYK